MKTLRHETGGVWEPPHWDPHVVLEPRHYGRGNPRETDEEDAGGRGDSQCKGLGVGQLIMGWKEGQCDQVEEAGVSVTSSLEL